MCKYLLCLLLLPLLCRCGSSRQTAMRPVSNSEMRKDKTSARVVEMNKGEWVLVAPNDSVVATVYVQAGSSRPDFFQSGMIRIVGEDGAVGFANEAGAVQIPPSFMAATPFSGPIAAVVPSSERVDATDGGDAGTLTGNERWGVIGKDGRYLRNPVFRRAWEEKLGTYVYTSPTSTFWIDEEGELHGF